MIAEASRRITSAALDAAAASLRVELAVIRAVAEVEAKGDGFLPDGRPKILFEAAQFGKRTEHVFDAEHPTISCRGWEEAKKHYKGGAEEYPRLAEARALAEKAALESTSWGTFQIMGFNARASGFQTVQDFVAAMHESADRHLVAFVALITTWKLDEAMRAKDWRRFARVYNGTGQIDHYATLLARAHRKHAA